ncbi:hypothetical protein A2881_00215 [Candidatus Peribacteria bacterium RIFCSPHIGHO2_01_FULL_55_13]|nr:MAG: hypothetical protein A2881_00215 [Candidatus Peribacteria bacterium RIFCSPHIGHO2_01_FULL_55_13]OGJ65279.1 MAG: hypothetical protein A3F36_00365 [Candidatus Peribacteria bacterium RIFCSPHIGHO2_12_FULL_55_11]
MVERSELPREAKDLGYDPQDAAVQQVCNAMTLRLDDVLTDTDVDAHIALLVKKMRPPQEAVKEVTASKRQQMQSTLQRTEERKQRESLMEAAETRLCAWLSPGAQAVRYGLSPQLALRLRQGIPLDILPVSDKCKRLAQQSLSNVRPDLQDVFKAAFGLENE